MHDKIIHDFVRLTLSVRLNGPLSEHQSVRCRTVLLGISTYIYMNYKSMQYVMQWLENGGEVNTKIRDPARELKADRAQRGTL